jgi:uncharacterized protein (TIGR02145 family)
VVQTKKNLPHGGASLAKFRVPKVWQGKQSGKGVEKVEGTIIEWFKDLEFYKQILAGVISSIIVVIIMYFFRNKFFSRIAKEVGMQIYAKELFTDKRDNKKYRIVKIGTQIWMAENLNYNGGSICYGYINKYYNNNSENGEKFGMLYDWETANKVCPEGWHLPSDKEWKTLIDFIGGKKIAGKKLKAKKEWSNNGNGTDEFGFSALPGGLGDSKGNFSDIGLKSVWWSSTEIDSRKAYIIGIDHDGNYIFRDDDDKTKMLSIRCVKD